MTIIDVTMNDIDAMFNDGASMKMIKVACYCNNGNNVQELLDRLKDRIDRNSIMPCSKAIIWIVSPPENEIDMDTVNKLLAGVDLIFKQIDVVTLWGYQLANIKRLQVSILIESNNC